MAIAPAKDASGKQLNSGTPITVMDILRDHRLTLARLPGQTSEFLPTEQGYEWRCQHYLNNEAVPLDAEGGPMRLVFSLLDLSKRGQPVAVLHLLNENPLDHPAMISLENLELAPEILNKELADRRVPVAAHNNAAAFVSALQDVCRELGENIQLA